MVLENVKIKVRTFGTEEIRCFIVEQLSSFADIRNVVRERFGNHPFPIYEIYYKDEDGDLMDVGSEKDFETMVRLEIKAFTVVIPDLLRGRR